MKNVLCILFLLNLSFSYSQFAIVKDSDGYVNVRSSGEIANNISDKLNNGFIVYYFEPKGNWANIDYKKNGKELNGYIYKGKIKFISDFTNIPLKLDQVTEVLFYSPNVKVKITESPFVKEKHKLQFLKEDSRILTKIDDLDFLGTDGEIPKRQYKSIEVQINNIKVPIPNEALRNLYEPSLYNSQINYDKINDILYIQSSNSDGAGGYEIIWVIEKKKYKTRIEAYGF
ncbi:hypothetical protein CLU81_5469 [Flavobacterium sp. 9]|uniref:hypothetical protein n=1 Tax=Flavobacterium sp. 9 TaxID=2035198 RepID=UPI000C17F505|nr:hypothetical protein [Flavobacterium sp. 9]PIF34804.1 hypothetical protein CLU81_5469 [Flavobacterium sp. 9]